MPPVPTARMHLPSIFLLLFIVPFLQAQHKPQPQPASYKHSQPISRANFERSEQTRLGLNLYISSEFKGIRFLTYNIHYHTDLHARKPNVANVLAEVQLLNPTIALFQEVLSDPTDPLRSAFEEGLQDLGYKFRHFRAAPGMALGNMIASKIPFESTGGINLSHARSLTEVTIHLADGSLLTIFGTHLEVRSPATRLQETTTILSHIQSTNPTNYILAADNNAFYQSPEMKVLTQSGLMANSFNVLHWDHPKYTCWAGHSVDFVFLSNGIQKNCATTYVYHTITSDHLPIIVDLDLPVNVDNKRGTFNMAKCTAAIGNSSSLNNLSVSLLLVSAVLLFI